MHQKENQISILDVNLNIPQYNSYQYTTFHELSMHIHTLYAIIITLCGS